MKIRVKLIRGAVDLTFKESKLMREMVEKNGHQSYIEVSVLDSGIGIKDSEQKNLFKLFGFLETTKELNTRGIGLGLHISKMIVE